MSVSPVHSAYQTNRYLSMNLSSTLYTSSLLLVVYMGQSTLYLEGNEGFHSPRGSRRLNDRIVDDRLVQVSAVQTGHMNALKLAPEKDIEGEKSRHPRDEAALKTAEGKVKDTYSLWCSSV